MANLFTKLFTMRILNTISKRKKSVIGILSESKGRLSHYFNSNGLVVDKKNLTNKESVSLWYRRKWNCEDR